MYVTTYRRAKSEKIARRLERKDLATGKRLNDVKTDDVPSKRCKYDHTRFRSVDFCGVNTVLFQLSYAARDEACARLKTYISTHFEVEKIKQPSG